MAKVGVLVDFPDAHRDYEGWSKSRAEFNADERPKALGSKLYGRKTISKLSRV